MMCYVLKATTFITILVKSDKFGLHIFNMKIKVKTKGKAITLRTWEGPKGSSRLSLPDFKTVGTCRC
jgi:hypothetical protein